MASASSPLLSSLWTQTQSYHSPARSLLYRSLHAPRTPLKLGSQVERLINGHPSLPSGVRSTPAFAVCIALVSFSSSSALCSQQSKALAMNVPLPLPPPPPPAAAREDSRTPLYLDSSWTAVWSPHVAHWYGITWFMKFGIQARTIHL